MQETGFVKLWRFSLQRLCWIFNYDIKMYTNREITTWYYVNSRRHVDPEKIRVPDGIWTHDPPWSSRMLYHWATGDSVARKGQIVGIDWNRIALLQSLQITEGRGFKSHLGLGFFLSLRVS